MEAVEQTIVEAVDWAQLMIEALGAALIIIGVVAVIYHAVASMLTRKEAGAPHIGRGVRLELSKYLILALEFFLAADILVTIMDPSWDELGRLAAIALLRTFLNYFLERDIRMLTDEPTVVEGDDE
jgi:uncharacterized membrane protein